jgi:transcriptional regulator with GAF, ATPase, and Fis domain
METALAALADLLASLAALGRSMQEAFDPQRFLAEFSARIQRLIPHDRLVLDYLDDDGSTFTVFAEHAPPELTFHETHYTTTFDPAGRYQVAEWVLQPVFDGETMRVDDFTTDPRFASANAHEQRVQATLRSALLVPMASGGRITGALVFTSRAAGTYTDAHVVAGREVSTLIGPFIENTVLLQKERRRRRRLQAVQRLTQVLGASLHVRDVFDRLAEEVRPVLDFDIMGLGLISGSGREVEMLAEVAYAPADQPTPPRMQLDDFSFASRIQAGEPAVIRDARVELDPSRPGDRMIVDGGGRSCLCVPLRFGERVAGCLYFGKRQPRWFDDDDVEIAIGVAAQLVLALQHQRLADEQRRLAVAEGRARRLERRVETLVDELRERYAFDRIVGRAAALREALDRAAKVAPTDTTVLITGESGTGKELVARAIHHASRRAEAPFVAVNCAAIPDGLLESELFGHERGAFTGADRQRPGRFEQAAGGTLFLDEVAELSYGVQAKLLRVLQEREFQRVGGTATLRADVRIVTATNRNLAEAVAAGHFREDLFYRLDVFTVHLPPLRERGDDVILLADHFVRALGASMGKGEPALSRDARAALLDHPWPGNIRELANAVERALIVSDGSLLTADQLGLVAAPAPRREAPETPEAPRSLPDWERQLVVDAVARAKGNKSRAARLLGLTRSQLYTRMKRFGLDG